MTLPICFVNIGGISNITVLDDQRHIYAYDAGPGMCLLDQYISRKKKINFDKGALTRDGPLEIPKQTYLVESVFIGFAVVAF